MFFNSQKFQIIKDTCTIYIKYICMLFVSSILFIHLVCELIVRPDVCLVWELEVFVYVFRDHLGTYSPPVIAKIFSFTTILGIHLSCKGGWPSHGANPALLGIGEAEENWVRVLYICQTNGEVDRWPIVTMSPVSPHTPGLDYWDVFF